MPEAPFPSREQTHVVLAHVAYRLGDALSARDAQQRFTEVRTLEALKLAMADADVLVVSGLWRNELIDVAAKLRFIQSIGAGTDQFPRDALKAKGIKLASAQGVNERAVAEHAMALILAIARKIHTGRDNQMKHHWRGMIPDPAERESELGGKTLVIVGMGRIGSRLAMLARAFDMRVIGVKRDPAAGRDAADEVVAQADLAKALARADVVALTCPLTPETTGLIGAPQLAAMKPSAVLVNVARGKVVVEDDLIAALKARRIAATALDCTVEEPLPATSPLWDMANVLITPHTAGETERYEGNVVDMLLDNLGRLRAGKAPLRNEIV
jgi:phosphoglycerate dehydrogenase-like enzyme